MKVLINYQDYTDVMVDKRIIRDAFPYVEIAEFHSRDSQQIVNVAKGAGYFL